MGVGRGGGVWIDFRQRELLGKLQDVGVGGVEWGHLRKVGFEAAEEFDGSLQEVNVGHEIIRPFGDPLQEQ